MFVMGKFNLKKLNAVRVKEEYHVKISYMCVCVALENLDDDDDDVDINRA
jgi:hypothetical protein